MHELSITKTMLDIVIKQAEENSASKVEKINLVIGEMSGIVDQCVEFYFGFLSKDTIAKDAKLNFRTAPAMAQCRNCKSEFSLEGIDWVCPDCGNTQIEITKGQEIYLESIEVADED